MRQVQLWIHQDRDVSTGKTPVVFRHSGPALTAEQIGQIRNHLNAFQQEINTSSDKFGTRRVVRNISDGRVELFCHGQQFRVAAETWEKPTDGTAAVVKRSMYALFQIYEPLNATSFENGMRARRYVVRHIVDFKSGKIIETEVVSTVIHNIVDKVGAGVPSQAGIASSDLVSYIDPPAFDSTPLLRPALIWLGRTTESAAHYYRRYARYPTELNQLKPVFMLYTLQNPSRMFPWSIDRDSSALVLPAEFHEQERTNYTNSILTLSVRTATSPDRFQAHNNMFSSESAVVSGYWGKTTAVSQRYQIWFFCASQDNWMPRHKIVMNEYPPLSVSPKRRPGRILSQERLPGDYVRTVQLAYLSPDKYNGPEDSIGYTTTSTFSCQVNMVQVVETHDLFLPATSKEIDLNPSASYLTTSSTFRLEESETSVSRSETHSFGPIAPYNLSLARPGGDNGFFVETTRTTLTRGTDLLAVNPRDDSDEWRELVRPLANQALQYVAKRWYAVHGPNRAVFLAPVQQVFEYFYSRDPSRMIVDQHIERYRRGVGGVDFAGGADLLSYSEVRSSKRIDSAIDKVLDANGLFEFLPSAGDMLVSPYATGVYYVPGGFGGVQVQTEFDKAWILDNNGRRKEDVSGFYNWVFQKAVSSFDQFFASDTRPEYRYHTINLHKVARIAKGRYRREILLWNLPSLLTTDEDWRYYYFPDDEDPTAKAVVKELQEDGSFRPVTTVLKGEDGNSGWCFSETVIPGTDPPTRIRFMPYETPYGRSYFSLPPKIAGRAKCFVGSGAELWYRKFDESPGTKHFLTNARGQSSLDAAKDAIQRFQEEHGLEIDTYVQIRPFTDVCRRTYVLTYLYPVEYKDGEWVQREELPSALRHARG